MSPSSRGYSERELALTPRMVAVLSSAAAGATARQTGAELNVSEGTVKTIRAAACARLGAPNLTAAVAIVCRRGEL